MGAERRPPVMADVARAAGVSHQTVSRVLNGHPNVRPATRAKVLAAIERLGYRRNQVARALATRDSRTLGVISFDTTLYGPASTLHGIERAARAAGYFVSIVSLRTIDRDGVREAIDHLAEQGVAGVVVVAPQRSAASALEDLPPGMPAVAVEGAHTGPVSTVCVDQVAGARLATEHLLALGHETVWHVSGPPDWLEAEGRVAGWRAALEAAGRPVPEPLEGDWSPRSGYAAGRRLAALAGEVGAVFVANDQMALGVLRALAEAGVRVPEEMSVVGFDDVPESAYYWPPLTTVRQDFGEVGREAFQLLLDRMSGAEAAARRLVEPELIVRDSTGPAPSGAARRGRS